jgi:enoyl-CoA hydratase/carnithine racemase
MIEELAGGDLLVELRDSALHVTFNRPRARNAMTDAMNDALVVACERADGDDAVRSVVLRGAGDRAFVAGTDISQFRGFTGEDGIDYEERVAGVLARLREVQVPVIAVIDGHCVGGGLGIAACADLRLVTPRASFGMPIARTLGNTLSAGTLHRLVTLLGESWVVRLVLAGERLSAQQADESGFARLIDGDIDEEATELARTIAASAPLTLWSIKELLRRGAGSLAVDDSDVITRVYGSDDFAGAVDAFLTKTPWDWQGR